MKLRKPLTLCVRGKPLNFELWGLNFELYDLRLTFELWTLRFELWTLWFAFNLWTLRFESWTLWFERKPLNFEVWPLSFILIYLSTSLYPTLIYLGSPPVGGVGGGFYTPSSSACSNSLFGCCCGWSLGVSSCVALLMRIRLILSMVTSNGTYSSLFGSGEPTLAPK